MTVLPPGYGGTPPFDPAAHPEDQRYQALTFAHRNEWLTFEHVTPGKARDRRYVITVDGKRRELTPAAVLPYVQGYADALRVGHALFPERKANRS